MIRPLALLCAGTLAFSSTLAPLQAAPAAAPAAKAPLKLPFATQKALNTLLQDPDLQAGHIGMAIVAVGKTAPPKSGGTTQFPAKPFAAKSQPLLFGVDAKRRFLPASNFKLFTAAWALQSLGAQRTFETRVFAAPIQFLREGVWPAKSPTPFVLTLDGDADPSFTSADLQELVNSVANNPKFKNASVLVRVAPSRWGAEENGGRYPDGWTLDDATWYYGAPITGWAFNRNQIDVTVKGAKGIGQPAQMTVSPPSPFEIVNGVSTVNVSEATGVHFDRGTRQTPFSDSLFVTGSLAPNETDTEGVAVPDPQAWLAAEFSRLLRAKGLSVITLDGGWLAQNAQVVATHQSAPLREILKRFLKNSDNLYGEMLLRNAAQVPQKQWPQVASRGLAAQSHNAMLDWLSSQKFPVEALRMSDGSGLSRYDLVTPEAIARLLALIDREKDGSAIYTAMPVAGVDGTLKNRMKNTAAQNNVRAKTGTFSIVNSLSGYVTTRGGTRLAVSILTNFVPDGEKARNWQGKVFALLANANF